MRSLHMRATRCLRGGAPSPPRPSMVASRLTSAYVTAVPVAMQLWRETVASGCAVTPSSRSPLPLGGCGILLAAQLMRTSAERRTCLPWPWHGPRPFRVGKQQRLRPHQQQLSQHSRAHVIAATCRLPRHYLSTPLPLLCVRVLRLWLRALLCPHGQWTRCVACLINAWVTDVEGLLSPSSVLYTPSPCRPPLRTDITHSPPPSCKRWGWAL